MKPAQNMEQPTTPPHQVFNQPLHYRTNNEKLAFALLSVGFKHIATLNLYNDATLDHLNMPSATAALKAGKPGQLVYVFENDYDLQRALQLWDATGEALDKGEQIEFNAPRAESIVLVRAIMRGYEPFRNSWKLFPGVYVAPNGGETKIDASGVEHPGFRFATTNLNETAKAKLFPQ